MAGVQIQGPDVNNTAGQLAVELRNDMTRIQQFNQWLTAVGGANYLETTLGMSSTDAQTIVSTYGNLGGLVNIYEGGAPSAAFDYHANTEALWGGQ